MTQGYTVSVSHKGRAVEFALDTNTTVAELKEVIAEEFGVEPGNQRLLPRGGRGTLTRDTDAVSAAIPSGTKVVLVGTATRDLQALATQVEKRQLGRQNYEKFKTRASDIYTTRSHNVRTLGDSEDEYTFHGFETLPNLSQRDKAMGILHRLAKDEGVRQIMKKRQYKVGILRELHPFERTILGYNRNRGEVIALRLRTDDLEGFRDYLSIRTVLMHELAHMVWDEHDERFRRLNSEHCREVIELDWTLRGRKLAGDRAVFYNPEESDDHVDGGSLKESGFVLGGQAPSMPAGAGDGDDDDPAKARRELMLRAWEKRSKKDA
ncbi:WLM-domain-containing protein [Martensiomyces pterosporus]|nr:WLM-domain-containing protein [Martensiomyces pterosporus]